LEPLLLDQNRRIVVGGKEEYCEAFQMINRQIFFDYFMSVNQRATGVVYLVCVCAFLEWFGNRNTEQIGDTVIGFSTL
jgi:hypothetical protein